MMTDGSDCGCDAVSVIAAKRDGYELSNAQIDWVLDGFTRGLVADEQMSALAMAIYWRGMSRRELSRWTAAMVGSGRRLDFGDLPRPTVDKHSTGGVGDKITLVLTPLVAACGAVVPQLSGRGLGHTGGTLDKLESIPGWRAELTPDRMRELLADPAIGAMICAAGGDVAPADRRLYALRDVTGTVESIPLIASSIMSKKIAEGTDALVLDVKVGAGAFMKNIDDAQRLASVMVELGSDAGLRTVALLTAMDSPLGRAVGNAVEVTEAVEVLAGGGPADVVELTLALAREMLVAAGIDDVDPADRLADGHAMDRWRAMIAAQGGDPSAALPTARHSQTVRASRVGVVNRIDAMGVGIAAWRLGAGRARPGATVQSAAGVELHVTPGDAIHSGQPVATIHTDTPEAMAHGEAALDAAVIIGSTAPAWTTTGPILAHIG